MSTTIKLIETGILMGIIHVLTGPDHLSALATICGTSITTHNRFGSFLLGIKWGLGHSLGLLVVGGLLIAMEDTEAAIEKGEEWIGQDHALSTIFEWFVGVFMLLLGFYGVHKACKNKREAASSSFLGGIKEDFQYDYPHEDEDEEEEESMFMGRDVEMSKSRDNRRSSMKIIAQMAAALNADGDSMREGSVQESMREGDLTGVTDVEARILHASESLRRNSSSHSIAYDSEDHDDYVGEQFSNSMTRSARNDLSNSFVDILTKEQPTMRASQLVQKHAAPENSISLDTYTPYPPINCNFLFSCCCCASKTDVLALLAGILHGVAGPGGVLGVIPAVQLRNAKLACIYLSTFCITSTLVMGGFAAFYGSFSEWLAGGSGRSRHGGCTRVFIVEIGSASLSIGVGIVWLVLLSVGKLQEVFP